MTTRRRAAACTMAVALLAGPACRESLDSSRFNPDWSTASHGLAAPNYAVAFPQDSVNRMDIVMTAADWAAIRQDVTQLLGFDFGARVPNGCCAYIPNEPKYVDVTLKLGGRTWKHVGFRLKGAASLQTAWNNGNFKLPFRLKFDEFEDEFPETWNQRLHGFRELAAAPGIWDASYLHEKLASDVFRLAGIPAPRTAFYRVYIDAGDGLRYRGLYTMVELPENTMLRDQFGEDQGNLYKPVTTFGSFSVNAFPKQNNEGSSYRDVEDMIAALNSPLRTTDRPRWRAGLEATFDVDHFLRWLAVNNAIGNWDTYGTNGHNFYLYNHSTRHLVWIPWDNNFAFLAEADIVGVVPRDYVYGGLSLLMNEVGVAEAPLIRYLADDSVYFARYRAHLRGVADSVITEARMNPLIQKYHTMILPWVVGPDGEVPEATHLGSPPFLEPPAVLQGHLATRREVIGRFLR